MSSFYDDRGHSRRRVLLHRKRRPFLPELLRLLSNLYELHVTNNKGLHTQYGKAFAAAAGTIGLGSAMHSVAGKLRRNNVVNYCGD